MQLNEPPALPGAERPPHRDQRREGPGNVRSGGRRDHTGALRLTQTEVQAANARTWGFLVLTVCEEEIPVAGRLAPFIDQEDAVGWQISILGSDA